MSDAFDKLRYFLEKEELAPEWEKDNEKVKIRMYEGYSDEEAPPKENKVEFRVLRTEREYYEPTFDSGEQLKEWIVQAELRCLDKNVLEQFIKDLRIKGQKGQKQVYQMEEETPTLTEGVFKTEITFALSPIPAVPIGWLNEIEERDRKEMQREQKRSKKYSWIRRNRKILRDIIIATIAAIVGAIATYVLK